MYCKTLAERFVTVGNDKGFYLSGKELLILKMLIAAGCLPLYGLELVRESGGMLKRGTVYATLGRMEEKGIIASAKEDRPAGGRGPRRRHYWATTYGKTVFEANRAAEKVLADS